MNKIRIQLEKGRIRHIPCAQIQAIFYPRGSGDCTIYLRSGTRIDVKDQAGHVSAVWNGWMQERRKNG